MKAAATVSTARTERVRRTSATAITAIHRIADQAGGIRNRLKGEPIVKDSTVSGMNVLVRACLTIPADAVKIARPAKTVASGHAKTAAP
jgi:hypothetical protein